MKTKNLGGEGGGGGSYEFFPGAKKLTPKVQMGCTWAGPHMNEFH